MICLIFYTPFTSSFSVLLLYSTSESAVFRGVRETKGRSRHAQIMPLEIPWMCTAMCRLKLAWLEVGLEECRQQSAHTRIYNRRTDTVSQTTVNIRSSSVRAVSL